MASFNRLAVLRLSGFGRKLPIYATMLLAGVMVEALNN